MKWKRKKKTSSSLYIAGLPTEHSLNQVSLDHLEKISDVVFWLEEYAKRFGLTIQNGFNSAYRLLGTEDDVVLLYEETLMKIRSSRHVVFLGQLDYMETQLLNNVGTASWLLLEELSEQWIKRQSLFTLHNPFITYYPEQDFFGIMYDVLNFIYTGEEDFV